MIERRLVRQLEKAARRFRHLRVVVSWAVVWTVAAGAAFALMALNQSAGWFSPSAALMVAVVASIAAFVVGIVAMRSVRDYHNVAQRVEDAYPNLNAGLLAAVTQEPQLPNGRFSYLQATVIQDALHHAYAYSWKRVVPWSRLVAAHVAHLIAFAVFVGSLALLSRQVPHQRIANANEEIVPKITESVGVEVTVEPGNTEVERGAGLLVQARFTGSVPLEATLVYEVAGEVVRSPMLQPLQDAVFGGRIREVNTPLRYRVEYSDAASDSFEVGVFEFPNLVRADAKLTFPNYTSIEPRLVQDVRRISAVEGTTVELRCYLNKVVDSVTLVPKNGETIHLELGDEDKSLYLTELILTESKRFKLELVDTEGRTNKQPPMISINVLPNKPPDLKLVQPSRDMRVSPVEELDLRANVWDDFGVAKFGLAYAFGGAKPVDVILGESAAAKQRTVMEHLVAFEELEAEPDQLMSYHFWAEDMGPDGQVRRVASDMYFAEVRHFEEIFREGQAPPGGEPPEEQSESAKKASELAELQKQIINGTWKVIRRELGPATSDGFAGDAKLLAESQADAMTQVEELAKEIRDPQAKSYVTEVLTHMGKALVELSGAEQNEQVEQTRTALSHEQAAYQALLKLRAREFEVTRSQQSPKSQSSSSSSSSRQQQQLQQLELDNEENRYETEQAARSQKEQQARENRQVLNRLGELARRQGDLNERLKELQSALEEAESEAEREEIRKQLKRLQDEQQQVLRDTEELQERMERPDNQEQMAEAREQLEETRENVRQASKALEEGRVSKALASGTRAENDLDEMKEEFRRRTAGQFTDEMREMRDEARELDETEQDLSERLAQLDDPNNRPTSLRDTGGREELVAELEQQTERTKQLLERMQETVLEAEETEPLLADRLYEAARKARQQELDSTLNTSRRMLEYGFVEDAKREESIAREGINQLRDGVERATESVLGDETEALRRAREALEELNRQLDGELERQNPKDANDASQGESPGEATDSNQRRSDDEPTESHEGGSPESGKPNDSANDVQESMPSASPSNSEAAEQRPEQSDQPGGSKQSDEPTEGESPSQGQPGEQPSATPPSGQPGAPSQQPGQSQGGEEGRPTERSPSGQAEGSPSPQGQQPQGGSPQSPNGGSRGGFDRAFSTNFGETNQVAPIGGDDFVEWSDQLRDVEEMLDAPDLRAEAARIRDRAKGFRIDLKRHSKEPSWDLVELQVARPLAELRDRVIEELLRRTGDDTAVPLDRDPVPARFSEQVRRYYEQLGSGE